MQWLLQMLCSHARCPLAPQIPGTAAAVRCMLRWLVAKHTVLSGLLQTIVRILKAELCLPKPVHRVNYSLDGKAYCAASQCDKTQQVPGPPPCKCISVQVCKMSTAACMSRAAKGKSTGLYDRWAARAKTRIGAAGEAEDPRSNSRARDLQDR